MSLPHILENLRREQIVNPVQKDPRTVEGNLLGVSKDLIVNEVIGGGQADFKSPWKNLSPEDRVLLYAYFNQKGHIEELLEAFRMLFKSSDISKPIVIDLGCGPFTAGLALSEVLDGRTSFSYIGLDHSTAMHNLGEQLAIKLSELRENSNLNDRQWVTDLNDVYWNDAPGWRPTIVIVSYLLASPSLDPIELIESVEKLLTKLGNGPTIVLYTNAPGASANRSFPNFSNALESKGFELIANDQGSIEIQRFTGPRTRHLRYALFRRESSTTLKLEGA